MTPPANQLGHKVMLTRLPVTGTTVEMLEELR